MLADTAKNHEETELSADRIAEKPIESTLPLDELAPHESQWIGRVEFAASTPQDACDSVIALSKQARGLHIHLANAYTVALADENRQYREVLAAPALNFPDGKPISWASMLRRHSPRLHQVRGPQLFLDVFDQGRVHSVKHFLLGSTPEVLHSLEANLTRRFPGINIVGVESPPFRELTVSEFDEQDARIAASRAHIVWVGLGTPKQDLEARRIAGQSPVLAIAIGAAFDFAAGTLRPAPRWMTAVGLEWVYRFVKEPRRLWKRYLFGNMRFIKAAASKSKGN